MTVPMDKTNYHDKMDVLVNDKLTRLQMTSAQVVETSVNVISNSPSHTHPADRTSLNYDMTPGFTPLTILVSSVGIFVPC